MFSITDISHKTPQNPHISENPGNFAYPRPYFPPTDFYGINYGMFLPPYPYQAYYGTNTNPFQNDYPPFTNPPPDTPQYTSPYDGPSSTNPHQPQNNLNNQFFPGTQPVPNSFIYPENSNGNAPLQTGVHSQKNSYIEDYKAKSIQQLKAEVDSLQQYLGRLRNSGPAKNTEDLNVIPKLESQINELQGNIVILLKFLITGK